MRKINKERVAEALGITEEGLDELLARQKGLLLKRGKISAANLLHSYAFLIEIKEREEEEKKRRRATTVKNVKIAKYAKTIEDLYAAGYGAIRISKYLYENHREKISKSSIERYIKEMGLRRDQ